MKWEKEALKIQVLNFHLQLTVIWLIYIPSDVAAFARKYKNGWIVKWASKDVRVWWLLVWVGLDGPGQVVPTVDSCHQWSPQIFQPDALTDSGLQSKYVASVDVEVGEDVGLVKKQVWNVGRVDLLD